MNTAGEGRTAQPADDVQRRIDDSAATVRKELEVRFAEFEEKQKARDPNLISAARTLIDDVIKYAKRERTEFPREALIGVIGAYLRPRMVVVFGSLIALLIALGEFWLIYRQNRIIEGQTEVMRTQTGLLEDQARITRAEIVSKLLPALRSKDSLNSDDTILIAAYGPVAIDVLVPVVTNGYPSYETQQPDAKHARNLWLNAADVVMSNFYRLDSPEMQDVSLDILHAADLTQTHLANTYASVASARPIVLDTRSDDVNDDYRRILRLLERHFSNELDVVFLRTMPKEKMDRAIGSLTSLYLFMHRFRIAGSQQPIYRAQPKLDQSLSNLCNAMNSGFPARFEGDSPLGDSVAVAATLLVPEPLTWEDAVSAVIQSNCASERFHAPKDDPEIQQMQRFAVDVGKSLITKRPDDTPSQ